MSKPPIRREPDPLMGSKAFESPLISHARMRGLYRALVESRVLGRKGGWPKHFEACWVATALDLRDGDLTSDAQAAWLTNYVRALGAREAGPRRHHGRGEESPHKRRQRESVGVPRQRLRPHVLRSRPGHGPEVHAARTRHRVRRRERAEAAANGSTSSPPRNDGALPLIIVVNAGPTEPPYSTASSIPVIPVDAGRRDCNLPRGAGVDRPCPRRWPHGDHPMRSLRRRPRQDDGRAVGEERHLHPAMGRVSRARHSALSQPAPDATTRLCRDSL